MDQLTDIYTKMLITEKSDKTGAVTGEFPQAKTDPTEHADLETPVEGTDATGDVGENKTKTASTSNVSMEGSKKTKSSDSKDDKSEKKSDSKDESDDKDDEKDDKDDKKPSFKKGEKPDFGKKDEKKEDKKDDKETKKESVEENKMGMKFNEMFEKARKSILTEQPDPDAALEGMGDEATDLPPASDVDETGEESAETDEDDLLGKLTEIIDQLTELRDSFTEVQDEEEGIEGTEEGELTDEIPETEPTMESVNAKKLGSKKPKNTSIKLDSLVQKHASVKRPKVKSPKKFTRKLS